jgi:hypothetical protein
MPPPLSDARLLTAAGRLIVKYEEKIKKLVDVIWGE